MDSIFADENPGGPETGEGEDMLRLDGEPTGEQAGSGFAQDEGTLHLGNTGAEPAPLEYELSNDEYDEELISIFLKKLKTDIEYIQARIAEYLSGGDKEVILGKCYDAIARLASSANYMEYVSLTSYCEEWQDVVEGYLTDISSGVTSDVAAELQEFIDNIIKVYPQVVDGGEPKDFVNISNEEDEQQRSDNDFFVAEEFLSAPESLQDEEVPDVAEIEDRQDADETQSQDMSDKSSTDQTERDESGSEDKELFDKLASALEVSEHVPGGSESSIDTVIEEIIEVPGQEDEQSAGAGSDMVTAETPEIPSELASGEDAAQDSLAHLLDQVVANHTDEIEAAITEHASDDESEADVDDAAVSEETEEERGDAKDSSEEEKDDLKPETVPSQVVQDEKEQKAAKKPAVRSSIRVDAEKIDYLMNQVGELVVSRAYFAQLVNEMRGLEQQLLESSGVSKAQLKPLHEFAFRLSEAGVHLGRVSNELQEGVMKVRMLPIDQLFKRYPRLVRDLVHNMNKDVKLITKGEETELDKMVIESISDPLIHIIRNSVDHGIETVEERLRAGKPAQGTLVLEAFHESDHIVLEITDDGKGIDTQRIKAKALEKGLVRKEELERMTDQDLTHLIMLPGFSTAEKATKTSGRGVGMDVVKKNIEKLNGTVEIASEEKKGTRLRIKIPLTMAIIQALMVRVGQEKFTIPLTTVEETLRVFRNEISEIEGVDVIHLRDNTMPIFQLAKIYNIDRQGQEEDKMFVVVVSTGTQELGLVVDELLGQEEVVIKPLADYLRVESG
ncbi:MAG: chemotaxis protein CheA, partial [Candidatus Electrothrix sp. ATG1]|nr:chemotaxis protein CheA [Candidatus Electrothrix sp. ATG1]